MFRCPDDSTSSEEDEEVPDDLAECLSLRGDAWLQHTPARDGSILRSPGFVDLTSYEAEDVDALQVEWNHTCRVDVLDALTSDEKNRRARSHSCWQNGSGHKLFAAYSIIHSSLSLYSLIIYSGVYG